MRKENTSTAATVQTPSTDLFMQNTSLKRLSKQAILSLPRTEDQPAKS
jgi:hypothetical protein